MQARNLNLGLDDAGVCMAWSELASMGERAISAAIAFDPNHAGPAYTILTPGYANEALHLAESAASDLAVCVSDDRNEGPTPAGSVISWPHRSVEAVIRHAEYDELHGIASAFAPSLTPHGLNLSEKGLMVLDLREKKPHLWLVKG